MRIHLVKTFSLKLQNLLQNLTIETSTLTSFTSIILFNLNQFHLILNHSQKRYKKNLFKTNEQLHDFEKDCK